MKLDLLTFWYLAHGCVKEHGLELCGRAPFRRAMRDALGLLRERAPDAHRYVVEAFKDIYESGRFFYFFQGDRLRLRFRPEYSLEDWAGTLVHAAVHFHEYRSLVEQKVSAADAVRATFRADSCRQAQEEELKLLLKLGVKDPPANVRARQKDHGEAVI